MDYSRFFIERPRFSGVIAILMVLIGLITIIILPISQYPQITPPQIIVSANYPGASASVLSDTVSVPIENALNGIDGALYMSSVSSDNGTYQLTITFDIGVDPDMAQVKVENRLNQVKSLLPDIVNQEGIDISIQSADILGYMVLESPDQTFTGLDLSSYAYSSVKNPLARVPGISDVTVYGPQTSMRIWLDSLKLTALHLSTEDVVHAVESQNRQAAIGSIGSAPTKDRNNLVIGLMAKGLLKTVSDFEKIIINVSPDGGIVYLKDVAQIEVGADNYNLIADYNGKPAVVIALSQTPGSNSLRTMNLIKQEIQKLNRSLPNGMSLKLVYDSTNFVRESIKGIIMTLWITFLLVIGIVYLFLQNLKATIIPMLTIPVSLIATFIVIYAIGFDINILTLFALILAIGLVVDDAIVVVERVQYLIQYKKMDSITASIQAMKDIGGSVIATTLVLLSIFIPVGMIPGMTGKIYQQFAVTISMAVFFSSINALTLSPALCAIFLKGKTTESFLPNAPKKGRFHFGWHSFFDSFNRLVEYLEDRYVAVAGYLVTHLWSVFVLMSLTFMLIVFLFLKIPTSFVPTENQDVVFASIQLPNTAGIDQTQRFLRQLETPISQERGVEYFIGIAGSSLLGNSGENIGMAVVGLKPWDERPGQDLTSVAIQRRLRQKYGNNPDGKIDFFALPAIPGVGNSDGLSFQLNAIKPDAKTQQLQQALNQVLTLIQKHKDVFSSGFSTFIPDTAHFFLDVDRDKLASYHIPLSSLFQTLQHNVGSVYINNIVYMGQINQVILQSDFWNRADMSKILDLYVPNQSGELVQIKNFVSVRTVLDPPAISKYNQYLTASITAEIAEGSSSGSAIQEIKKILTALGKDFDVSWTGLTLQEVKTGGIVLVLVALSFIFSYLFLVALYESWLISFSVIFASIFGVLGSFIGLYLMRLPLSIYAQLGIVLLVGLASKNAILIVQFMLSYYRQGVPLIQASIKGAKERFRAVVMTAMTFILGVLPMLFATGAGAGSQVSMGTSVFFGMVFATGVGILFVPALFRLFMTIATFFTKRPYLKQDEIKRKRKR